jgi:hypothetical protein
MGLSGGLDVISLIGINPPVIQLMNIIFSEIPRLETKLVSSMGGRLLVWDI